MRYGNHDPHTGRFQLSNEVGRATRFRPGNQVGQATRFAPGQSGNLKGRPPKVDTCIDRLKAAGVTRDELHAIIDNPAARVPERIAALKLLIERYRKRPFGEAIHSHAWCRYFDLRTLEPQPLMQILLDRSQSPTEREAARLALEKPLRLPSIPSQIRKQV